MVHVVQPRPPTPPPCANDGPVPGAPLALAAPPAVSVPPRPPVQVRVPTGLPPAPPLSVQAVELLPREQPPPPPPATASRAPSTVIALALPPAPHAVPVVPVPPPPTYARTTVTPPVTENVTVTRAPGPPFIAMLPPLPPPAPTTTARALVQAAGAVHWSEAPWAWGVENVVTWADIPCSRRERQEKKKRGARTIDIKSSWQDVVWVGARGDTRENQGLTVKRRNIGAELCAPLIDRGGSVPDTLERSDTCPSPR